jgi:hypothetical protein
VQRRIEQANRHRQPLHRGEDADEVLALVRQQLRAPSRVFAGGGVGQDHLAHRADAIAFEEHVLGAAEADALGAELARPLGVFGVSALVRTLSVRYLSAHFISVANSPESFGSWRRTSPTITSPVEPSMERVSLVSRSCR